MSRMSGKIKGTEHSDQLKRLRRIEGQVRGVAKMVEDQRYCMDILTQIKAAKSALARVEASILKGHLDHCVKKAMTTGSQKEAQKAIDEILKWI